jgi:RNA polymerase sigma-70 factor (ECF subfamily)
MGWLRSRPLTNDSPPEDQGGSDAMLVAQAKQGDARAFALLYRRYLDQVYDYAAKRLESREVAEDATQTIFLRAVASLKDCRDGAVFAGWLFAIARHVITDHYRARRLAISALDAAPDLEDPDPTPEEAAVRSDQSRELREARERCLTPAERDIFDLRLQGLSDQEIAAALGRGHGAIRTAQFRLVQKLRECLGVVARERGARRVEA